MQSPTTMSNSAMSPAETHPSARGTAHFYLSLYLLIAAIYLLTASGRVGLSDGVAMFNVAESIVNERSVSSEPCQLDMQNLTNGAAVGCVPGRGGRHYAGFGLLPSLVASPVIAGTQLISTMIHVNPLVTGKAAVSILTVLISPLVCLALAMWIEKLGYTRRTALIGACILAFASPFWHFSVKGFYSEPYFTLPLVIAALALSVPRRGYAYIVAGLAFGLACTARVNGVILMPAFILSIALHARVRRASIRQFVRDAAQFCGAFSVFALLIALSNYERFGSPFKTGYHLAFPSSKILLATPLLEGIRAVLFSGEFGLLLFAPWILIAIICVRQFARSHPAEATLCGTMALSFILFFAKFPNHSGGWVAGPRYLVPILPFLALVMVPAIQRMQEPEAWQQRAWVVGSAVAMVLISVGFLIQATGSFLPEQRYYTLAEFYQHQSTKPWWSGSIPFASIDFVFHMKAAKAESADTIGPVVTDQLSVDRAQEHAFASISSHMSEQDFLRSFPNPENFVLPNLMVAKMRLLGLPGRALYGYLILIAAAGLTGLLGLKRSAEAQL